MSPGRHHAGQPTYLRAVRQTAGTGIVRAAVGTITGLCAARFLGSADRGTFAAVVVYTMSTAALLECGITTSVCFYTARLRDQAADIVRTGAWLIVFCGVLAGTVGYFAAPLIMHGHPEEGVTALRLAFAVEPLIFLGGVWASSLQATDVRAWNLTSLVQPVCYAIAVALVAVLGQAHILGMTLALISSILVQCVAGWLLRRNRIPGDGRFNRRLVAPTMRYGLVNWTSRVPYLFNARLDQLILTLMVPPAALGNYAVAVSLSLLPQPVTAAFGTVAMPRIAAARDRKSVVGQGVLTTALLGSMSIGVAASLAVCGITSLLVETVLGPSFDNVAPLLFALAPGAAVYGTNKVMGDILRGFDRSSSVARAEGIALVLTISLNVLLPPIMGVMGAAVASSVAYGVAFLLLLQTVVRQTNARPAALAGRLRARVRSANPRTAPMRADQTPN